MTNPEPTIESRRIYQGRVVALRVDTVRLPNGRLTSREVVETRDAVAIVPVDSQGRLILVRQYRKPLERTLLEVPAGGVDDGEEPAACALRELLEETGYAASHMEPLTSFFTSPGFCTEQMHAFLATGLVAGRPRPEADESIEVVRVPLASVPEMIARGEIRDAKSITSLLLALPMLEGLALERPGQAGSSGLWRMPS